MGPGIASRGPSQVVSLRIFFRGSFRQNHVPWGRLRLWKWVPGTSPGVKAAGAFGWRNTTLVVPKVENIRCLNLPGTPRATSACRGIPLLCIYRTKSHFCRWEMMLKSAGYDILIPFWCTLSPILHCFINFLCCMRPYIYFNISWQ